MILGYVTNGFAHHTLADAIHILAEIGYRSVAITLDAHHLNPLDENWPTRVQPIKHLLRETGLRCTVETGARFLLDRNRKHQPTLLSVDESAAGRRIEYLCRAMDIAAELEADCVSLWSGTLDEGDSVSAAFDRLCGRLHDVLDHAEDCDMRLAFEPEPGMLIERMHQFDRLHKTMNHPLLGLTLDIGHVHCLDDGDLFAHVSKWRDVLLNVHIEDMRRGVHEHLFFGEGDLNVSEAMASLTAADYAGSVHVELSRHSHDAPDVAARAYALLSALSQ